MAGNKAGICGNKRKIEVKLLAISRWILTLKNKAAVLVTLKFCKQPIAES